MSGFDERWGRLARAASRMGDSPLPPAPDGARLLRRAAAARAGASPASRRLAPALALTLLWAAAIPAALPAWRASRAVWVRLVWALPAKGAPDLAAPPPPSSLPPKALGPPRLPPLPDIDLRPFAPSATPRKEPS